MTDKKKYTSFELYRRLFLEVKPFRLHIGTILLVTLLSPPLSLLVPLPLKIAVDSVIGSHPIPAFLQPVIPQAIIGSPNNMLTFVIVLTMLVALLGGLQRVASTWLRTYTGEKLTLAFRNKLFRHVQRLSVSYHDTRGTTDSTYRIQYDAPAIQWIAVDGFVLFVSAGLTLAGMIYIITLLDWQLHLFCTLARERLIRGFATSGAILCTSKVPLFQ
jgi:ATP-binding cassette, subfamily B, bacterial